MGNDPFVDASESTSFPLPGTGKREGGEKMQLGLSNLCSGKPDLPVKMFLPLVPVKTYFTGKKFLSKKCLFASIFGTFLLEWTGLTFGS